MHPPDCPFFEYKQIPHHSQTLADRTIGIVAALRRGSLDGVQLARDSRPVHDRLFAGLTPLNCHYYAGHYRGETFRCLQHYVVGVPNDPRVGLPAEKVLHAMAAIARDIGSALEALDAHHLDQRLPHGERLYAAVKVACAILELILRVHPYANGNGHAARFIVWAVLGRYGYWPRDWPIEPRPPDPPYTDLIVQYRNGNPAPLEEFMLKRLFS